MIFHWQPNNRPGRCLYLSVQRESWKIQVAAEFCGMLLIRGEALQAAVYTSATRICIMLRCMPAALPRGWFCPDSACLANDSPIPEGVMMSRGPEQKHRGTSPFCGCPCICRTRAFPSNAMEGYATCLLSSTLWGRRRLAGNSEPHSKPTDVNECLSIDFIGLGIRSS